MNAFREMAQMADRLNLPSNITDRANRLFKQIHDSKALRGGASNDAIASACVYISCRQEGVPRTFKGMSVFIISALEIVIELPKGRVVRNVFCRERWLAVLNSFYSLKLSRLCSPIVLVPGKEKCIYHTC